MNPFDPERLRALRVETRQKYTPKDCILYALGIGIGIGKQATQPAALRRVYEEHLVPVPTFATMLAYPGTWYKDPELGLDWKMLVNAEQSLALHAPLPVSGTVKSVLTVEHLTDKGAGRGLLIHTIRTLTMEDESNPFATIRQTYFCRGAGGFGGDSQGIVLAETSIPDRSPDHGAEIVTRPEAALLFRLSGDWNPIHIDPVVAGAAGFARPILHGLATFGIAAHAVSSAADVQPTEITARYSAPVTPGDALLCEAWREPDALTFRVTNSTTGRIALDRGRIAFAPSEQTSLE